MTKIVRKNYSNPKIYKLMYVKHNSNTINLKFETNNIDNIYNIIKQIKHIEHIIISSKQF